MCVCVRVSTLVLGARLVVICGMGGSLSRTADCFCLHVCMKIVLMVLFACLLGFTARPRPEWVYAHHWVYAHVTRESACWLLCAHLVSILARPVLTPWVSDGPTGLRAYVLLC